VLMLAWLVLLWHAVLPCGQAPQAMVQIPTHWFTALHSGLNTECLATKERVQHCRRAGGAGQTTSVATRNVPHEPAPTWARTSCGNQTQVVLWAVLPVQSSGSTSSAQVGRTAAAGASGGRGQAQPTGQTQVTGGNSDGSARVPATRGTAGVQLQSGMFTLTQHATSVPAS
jgi:hypothetical protein